MNNFVSIFGVLALTLSPICYGYELANFHSSYRGPFMSHLAAAPLNRASFTPTSFNASIPQYVILPNYKDPDTSMRYDMQFEVNPPQACLDEILYQMVRVDLGESAVISSVDFSECTCAASDLRYFCADVTSDAGNERVCMYINESGTPLTLM